MINAVAFNTIAKFSVFMVFRFMILSQNYSEKTGVFCRMGETGF
ncbi:hypothetical protein FCR2A7T_12810 [Flavobacterium cauense R2A-7]|nr:hypothetical protein FCR2A7T_12810 [Flavobacterium cauense R2A-7]